MTEVVAALIWDKDKFMICQQPGHKARELLWEFVGGKVGPGETMEQALVRECREELAITIVVKDIFMDTVHEYPEITIHLTLFNAIIAEGVPEKLEHNDIRWITVADIHKYSFCPADEAILRKLSDLYTSGSKYPEHQEIPPDDVIQRTINNRQPLHRSGEA